MNAEEHQMAADLWAKLADLSHRPACRLLGNHIYGRHLLLLRVSAQKLSRRRWLVTYPDSLPACKQIPVQVVTVQVVTGPSVN